VRSFYDVSIIPHQRDYFSSPLPLSFWEGYAYAPSLKEKAGMRKITFKKSHSEYAGLR
jgi:hypothetical protein